MSKTLFATPQIKASVWRERVLMTTFSNLSILAAVPALFISPGIAAQLENESVKPANIQNAQKLNQKKDKSQFSKHTTTGVVNQDLVAISAHEKKNQTLQKTSTSRLGHRFGTFLVSNNQNSNVFNSSQSASLKSSNLIHEETLKDQSHIFFIDSQQSRASNTQVSKSISTSTDHIGHMGSMGSMDTVDTISHIRTLSAIHATSFTYFATGYLFFLILLASLIGIQSQPSFLAFHKKDTKGSILSQIQLSSFSHYWLALVQKVLHSSSRTKLVHFFSFFNVYRSNPMVVVVVRFC